MVPVITLYGTILIFGGYALHSLIGSFLLQPVKWHMKTIPLCLETVGNGNSKTLSNNDEDTLKYNAEDDTDIQSSKTTTNHIQRERKATISSIDHDIEVGSIYGFDVSLPRRLSIETKTSVNDVNPDIEMTMTNRRSMTNLRDSEKSLKYPWWNSGTSINSIHLGSSIAIFEESDTQTKKLNFNNNYNFNNKDKNSENNTGIVEKDLLLKKPTDNGLDEKDCNSNDGKKESTISRIMQRIAVLYDLDLFRDPIYINMMLGMSIAIFAEVNFSLLTPFILADMNLTTADIASVMSVIAAVDLVSRGAAPFLGEWMKQSARMMYLFSLCLLIISRFSLIFTNSFTSMLIVAIGLGAAKGIRSVYMTLVIPSYVPIQKLPNASGIQMVTNGIVLTIAGPIIGMIRDNTGSYVPCIILINCVTFITIAMWVTEIIIVRRRSIQEKSKLSQKS